MDKISPYYSFYIKGVADSKEKSLVKIRLAAENLEKSKIVQNAAQKELDSNKIKSLSSEAKIQGNILFSLYTERETLFILTDFKLIASINAFVPIVVTDAGIVNGEDAFFVG